jgi:thiamine monophosphate kinase
LVDDIKKLSDLADCGISLSAERMPISDNAKCLLKKGTFTLEDYLTAGDDYQLAFTFNRKNIRYIKNLEKKFKLKISVIGELINKKGVFLNNKIIRGSFSHF